jgi:predicted aminopeptidase
VIAAPEFSLEPKNWCFLVSGCVPYRGYFKQAKAEIFAQKLDRKSYDVAVSPAVAYSTLGWFDDPLLDTMFQYNDTQMAAYIFHELAHQKLYVKGDASFNEAYASFVEDAGVKDWLLARHQEKLLREWQRKVSASVQFNQLLKDTREKLSTEYDSGHPIEEMRENKAKIFSQLENAYQGMVDKQWSGNNYYRHWISRDLNNAQMALMSTYQGGQCAFARLYDSAGREITVFHDLAAERARWPDNRRQAWLKEPCVSVAPDSDL